VGSGVRAVDIAADSSVLDDVALACHSFAPGTLVVLADGSTKPIDNVVVGDKVRTTGPATGKMVVRSVTAQHFNYDTDMADVTVRDASGHVSTIHTTQLHRFWDDSRGGGVDARALSPGDQLHAGDGVVLMVAVVRDWTAANWMYDITVDGVHTFYVGVGSSAILVHNCDLPGMPTDHAHFPSQQDALNAALQDNGVVTSDAPRAVYGQNPNMLGPNGGPSWQIDGLNSSGDLVTIEQHPPHFFNDTGTGFGPHYKGPDGFHYFWDGGG
jgi:hypothetical protein